MHRSQKVYSVAVRAFCLGHILIGICPRQKHCPTEQYKATFSWVINIDHSIFKLRRIKWWPQRDQFTLLKGSKELFLSLYVKQAGGELSRLELVISGAWSHGAHFLYAFWLLGSRLVRIDYLIIWLIYHTNLGESNSINILHCSHCILKIMIPPRNYFTCVNNISRVYPIHNGSNSIWFLLYQNPHHFCS